MTLNEYGENPTELGTFVSGSIDEYGVTVFGASEPTPTGATSTYIRLSGVWGARSVKVRVGGVWVDKDVSVLVGV